MKSGLLKMLLVYAAAACWPSAITFQSASAQTENVQGESVAPAEKDETKPAESKSAEPEPYQFTIETEIDTTDVKSQGSTGTCWCFASTSFIESELMRQGMGRHDLSEMFVVKNVYLDKARNYLRRHGKTNFGEGGLAHDFIQAAGEHGLVPESVYDGLDEGKTKHDHGEMFAVLNGMLEGLVKRQRLSDQWPVAFERVTATYLGESPTEFSFDGQTFTPKSFAEHLKFDAKNYVSLTSFNHRPFGEPFVLEIPDNFSSGLFQNVPIDELVATIDHAIANGFSVAWDGDVSEQGFSRSEGLAVLPAKDRKDYHKFPGAELEVDQEMRQATFEERTTTDDHLMHLTGIARDQHGNKYYRIKNSWGDVGKHKGYLYMSEAYVRLKTIAILLHADAIAPRQETATSPKT